MDKVKAILDGENEILVDGLFYLYNSKYYLIYTEKEIDENGYVVMHLSQVGKEIKKSENGTVDTGYMVGVEIQDIEDWRNVQKSISTIVDDKKNGKSSPDIKILPMNMIKKIKILGSKKFRLVKDLLEQHFEITFDNNAPLLEKNIEPEVNKAGVQPTESVDVNINDNLNIAETNNENIVESIEQPVLDQSIESINQPVVEEPVKVPENTVDTNILTPVEVEIPKEETENKEIISETIPQIENENLGVEEANKDGEALVFKPNLNSETENSNANSNENNIFTLPNVQEGIAESPTPLTLNPEPAEDDVDYESLYNEMKTNNENLKKRVQELELKLENIKKILG